MLTVPSQTDAGEAAHLASASTVAATDVSAAVPAMGDRGASMACVAPHAGDIRQCVPDVATGAAQKEGTTETGRRITRAGDRGRQGLDERTP